MTLLEGFFVSSARRTRAQKPPAGTTAGITEDINAEEYSRGGSEAGGRSRSGKGGGDNSNFKEVHNMNSSSDSDSAEYVSGAGVGGCSVDSADDECSAYVHDDIAREYARVLPDEQISI